VCVGVNVGVGVGVAVGVGVGVSVGVGVGVASSYPPPQANVDTSTIAKSVNTMRALAFPCGIMAPLTQSLIQQI